MKFFKIFPLRLLSECQHCYLLKHLDSTSQAIQLFQTEIDPPPNVGRSPFIRRAFVERLLPARPRCHREESDTVFLSCAYCVLGGGRNSYRCMENVTFTAESGRSRQAFAGGRKERICQVFPSFTPNCRAAVHLSLYSG